MQVRTNRWIQKGYERVHVGCSGYDDPIYESRPVERNCEEQIVEWDYLWERKAFHTIVIRLRKYAEHAADVLIKATHDKHMATYQDELNAYNAEVARIAGLSKWKQFWSPTPYMPDKKWHEEKAEWEIRSSKTIKAMNVVLKFPLIFESMVHPIKYEEYELIMQLHKDAGHDQHPEDCTCPLCCELGINGAK